MHTDTNVRCDRSRNSVVADQSEPENLENLQNNNLRNQLNPRNTRNRVTERQLLSPFDNGLEAESKTQ